MVALVLVAGTGTWLLTRDPDTTDSPTYASVTAENYKQTASVTGTVAPARQSDLDFAVSGKVNRVYTAVGDTVTKGETLATVGAGQLEADRTAASSNLAAAQAQLSEDTGAGDVQLAADDAAVTAARSRLDAADQAVDDATLRSPISGTVVGVGVARGDQVSGGDGGTQGEGATPGGDTNAADSSSTPAFSVVSTGSYLVNASVAAAGVKELKKGMQAEVTLAGRTGTVYGTVSSIGLVATVSDSGAATFPVVIRLTGKPKDVYIGTTATASIITQQRTGVLAVPTEALRTKTTATGTETYLYRKVDGKRVRTVVSVGTVYGPMTEITKGVEAGDKVEIPGMGRPMGSGSKSSDLDAPPRVLRGPPDGSGSEPGATVRIMP